MGALSREKIGPNWGTFYLLAGLGYGSGTRAGPTSRKRMPAPGRAPRAGGSVGGGPGGGGVAGAGLEHIGCRRRAARVCAGLLPRRTEAGPIPLKDFDPTLSGAFHMDWLVALDETTADDLSRAVAEKADVLLRAARFIDMQHLSGGHDVEVRVWVEAARGAACVSVTWEPGPGLYGFHLLDETLKERLGCVVFHDVPCVDAQESAGQADKVLDAALRAVMEAAGRRDADLPAWADDVRHAVRAVRVPVKEGPLAEDGGAAEP